MCHKMETVCYYGITFYDSANLKNMQNNYWYVVGDYELDSIFYKMYKHCQTIKDFTKISVQKRWFFADINNYCTFQKYEAYTNERDAEILDSIMHRHYEHIVPQGISPENLLKLIVPKYLHTELLLEIEPRLRDLMPLYTSMLCGPNVSSIMCN